LRIGSVEKLCTDGGNLGDLCFLLQGRLADKHNSVSRDELLTMVRFGANEILAMGGATVTDDDIDLILRKGKRNGPCMVCLHAFVLLDDVGPTGEARTEEQNAKYKTDMQHNLANFTLVDEDEMNLFEFDGENYKSSKNYNGKESWY